jgi:ribosomal protein S18 acetylase RimI-like enzyme
MVGFDIQIEPFEVPTDRAAVLREIQERPLASPADVVRQGLALFNIAHHGELHAPLQAFLRESSTGRIEGGLLGRTGRGGFHIEHLWVAEAFRRLGHGAELLVRSEAEAQLRGCRFAYLETYSFQNPRFYQQNGYSVFGRLAGFSGDHVLFYLRKTFRV